MVRRPSSRRIGAFGALALALPWCAMAQSQSIDTPAPPPKYRDTWYQQRVEPALLAKGPESPQHGPVLYEPNEPPLYTPIPERRTWTHRARVGSASLAMCTGDLQPTRDQWIDVRDWNDPLGAPEMFRVYFEPGGPAPVGANAR